MRSALLAPALLLLPALAHAQQPHWSNTSEWGVRVTPAIIAEQPWRIRMGANGGIVAREDVPGSQQGEDITAFAGQLALSYHPPFPNPKLNGLEILFSGASTYVSALDPRANVDAKPSFKANLGDAFFGARYAYDLAPWSFGGEIGPIIYGQVSPKGGTSLQITAGHPVGGVARALGSFRTESDLVVSANAGFLFDRSWDVWKAIAEEEDLCQDDAGSYVPCATLGAKLATPGEDLRTAYAIYGDGKNINRIVFGVGGSKAFEARERGSMKLIPFFEVSGEMNDGELVTRATPGIGIESKSGTRVLASADIRLAPAPFSEKALESSPGEPDVRVNLGLQFALGERLSPAPRRTPTPRNYVLVSVVHAETGKPLAGVAVGVFELTNKDPRLKRTTGDDGVARFDRGDLLQKSYFKTLSESVRAWPPLSVPPQGSNDVKLLAYETVRFTPVRIDFKSGNQPFQASDIKVTFTSPSAASVPITRLARGATFQDEVPSGPWRITLSCKCTASDKELFQGDILAGNTFTKTVWLTPDPVTKALTWDLDGPVAVATPSLQLPDAPLRGIFEPDLAEPKATAELRNVVALLQKHPNVRAEFIVHVKKAGDPLFLETLAKARMNALNEFFQALGARAKCTRTKTDASEDLVLIEWKGIE